jgi:Tfp pilus assembly protein PilN
VLLARLNLASHPFRNRTLPWAITVVVACTSLVALVFIVAESRKTNAQAALVEADVAALRKQRTTLQDQAAQVRASVPPDHLRTLTAAHALVDRKRFSWSKLLADLESSLPGSVRVSRINVREVTRVGGQTRADLDLSVVGRTPLDVTQMISEMNRTGIFSAVPVSESPKTGRGESGFEWALRVGYVQRTVGPSDNQQTASVASSVRAPDSTTEARQQ